MKNTNSTGIIVIVGILTFGVMKAFDISFNLSNLKIMGSISIGVIVTILVFLSMQSKKTSNPQYYKDNEVEDSSEDRTQNSKYHTAQPNPQNVQKSQEEEDEENNRYNYSVQPPAPSNYAVTPEEDNRWS